MKDYYQMIKRWDIIIVIGLIFLSFLPFAVFSYQQSKLANGDVDYVAVITVDNKPYKEITLTGNTGTDVFDITQSKSDVNTIEVVDEQIRIRAATCSDQVCVRTGYISKPGETIVCLPHKVVIEIQAEQGHTDDVIISS